MEGCREKALNKAIKTTLSIQYPALLFELFGSYYVLNSR